MKREYRKYLRYVKNNLSHFQNSVFRGEITPSKLMKLKLELQKIIVDEEDFVCIIKLMNDNVFGEDILGKKDIENGESLIL